MDVDSTMSSESDHHRNNGESESMTRVAVDIKTCKFCSNLSISPKIVQQKAAPDCVSLGEFVVRFKRIGK
ncbi:hypothetical protein HAX54_040137 [Datura stramonium]|uniref:Uncharacterized protein n=1 Tax=Datura stramonium TaxID=4076 RepID=A0ABS8VR10_DATST|nr:hypothetical protein [Datura stramonium]